MKGAEPTPCSGHVVQITLIIWREAVQRAVTLTARVQLPLKNGQWRRTETVVEFEWRALICKAREHRRGFVVQAQQGARGQHVQRAAEANDVRRHAHVAG